MLVNVADAAEYIDSRSLSGEYDEIQLFPKKNTKAKWEKSPFEPSDISFVKKTKQAAAVEVMTPYAYFKLFMNDNLLSEVSLQ